MQKYKDPLLISTSNKLLHNLTTPLQQSLIIPSQTKLTSDCTHKILNPQSTNLQFQQPNIVGDSQVQILNQIVSNLLNKNKINTKNAFEIPVLNMNMNSLRIFCEKDQNSWKKISSFLENSYRVYGYRVDCMNQNVNKMITFIARTVQTQQNNTNSQAVDAKVQYNLPVNQQYREIQLNMHLQQNRLKQDNLYTNVNIGCYNDYRIRRLMDQNGLMGLVLATVPLKHNLQIMMIVQNNQCRVKRQDNQMQDQKDQGVPGTIIYVLKQIRNNSNQLKILKQIQQLNPNDPTFEQQPQHNNQYLSKFISYFQQTQPQLQATNIVHQDLSPKVKYQFNLDQLFANNQNNQTQHKIKNKPIQKNKGKDKNKKNRKYKKNRKIRKQQEPYYQFQYQDQNVLKKSQILKFHKTFNTTKAKIKTQGNNSSQINLDCKNNNNLYDNKLTGFQMQVFVQFSQNNNKFIGVSEKVVDQQTNINNLNQKQQINEGILISSMHEVYKQNQGQQERNGKCIQIRQNKAVLSQILSTIQGQIQFSKIYKMHQCICSSCSEALDFLSVLHLSNQQGLSLESISLFDFIIKK